MGKDKKFYELQSLMMNDIKAMRAVCSGGNNIFTGGMGNNTMIGGLGSDTAIFTSAFAKYINCL